MLRNVMLLIMRCHSGDTRFVIVNLWLIQSPHRRARGSTWVWSSRASWRS
jgi:hypothetical protein